MEGDTEIEAKNVIIPNNRQRVSLRIELILRIFAAIGTLASVVFMATSTQTIPSSVQFLQFKAQYDDFPAFKFFLVANSIGCGYVVFSIPFSIFHTLRGDMPKLATTILLIFDTVMLVVVTSGASAAGSIVYVAHKGNVTANWLPICPRVTHFCNMISASLVASFFSILIFIFVVFTSLIYM